MKKYYLFNFLLAFLLSISYIKAQVTANPAIFTADQAVTLTYDATQSQGQALANLPPSVTTITAHVGAILVDGGTTWMHVPGVWGSPNAQPKFTRQGTTNIYTLNLPNGIRSMFTAPAIAPPSTTPIFRVGMVFRENGPCGNFGGVPTACKEGKSTTGQDIFLNVNQGTLDIAVTSPTNNNFFVNVGQNQTISGTTNIAANLEILVNNVSVQTANNATSISTVVNVVLGTPFYDVVLKATPIGGGTPITRNVSFLLRQNPTVQAIPTGMKDGINYHANDDTKVTLVFTAPEKKFIYVVGEFNNWQLHPDYLMKQVPGYGGSGPSSNPDNNKFWLEITGLTPGQKYAFQYAVYDMAENVVFTGDPYAEEVLDQFDSFIPAETYPNPKPYPTGRTGVVPLLQTARPAYNWSPATLNFQKPDKKKLIIYEVWVNDFDEKIIGTPPNTTKISGNFQMLIDKLDYIQNLGVNALQLMPIMEFNGNISWGYNSTYFCAVDKAYGTRDKLKELIDKCHQRGIAVILDVALNHAEFEFPGCKMYWNSTTNKPASNNPWFNVQATHPFSVFQDFNHESPYTQQFSKRVIEYWINEFKIDGYRYDLAKGLVQNAGADWNHYNSGRITILKRIADWQWAADPTSLCIFEFLATGGAEEAEYANYRVNENPSKGIMLWRNMEANYAQNIMGYASNGGTSNALGDVDFANNPFGSGVPFTVPHVLSYMESHDEERVMFKALQYGNNSQTNHNVRNLATALDRTKAAIAFHIPVVGPKMIWQFGELGYDFSLGRCPDGTNGATDGPCRTDPKPVRWDYFTDVNRKSLYDYYSAVNKLKTTYNAFSSTDVFVKEDELFGRLKQLKITPQPYTSTPTNADQMNILILANFDVVAQTINAAFHHTGTWYNYFDLGTEFVATSTSQPIVLQPGEVRFYTNFKLPAPAPGLTPYLGPFAFPTGLTATALSANSIKLDWTDTATNKTGVRILRSTSLNGTYVVVATLGANAVTFNDTGLSANTEYFYKVETFNNFGAKQSNTANATTTGVVINPANAPTNLTITSQTVTAINLTWTDASTDETDFIVQRSVGNNTNFTDLAVRPANSTTYTDNAVTIGNTYFYRVCARKTGANNACSNEVTTGILPIENNAIAQTISVFPNPTSERVHIKTSVPYNMMEVTITDVMGKRMGTYYLPKGETNLELSLKDLSQGVYFLQFNTEKGQASKRIIKN